MSTILSVSVIWLVAILIVTPWLVLFVVPSLLLGGALPPMTVALGAALAFDRRAARRQGSHSVAVEDSAPFHLFIQDVPELRAQREAVEAMLEGRGMRASEQASSCACMLHERDKVVLTVRFHDGRSYESHQVRASSARDAVLRMESKLGRSASQNRVASEGCSGAPFCSQPWCCNGAHCPYGEARTLAIAA